MQALNIPVLLSSDVNLVNKGTLAEVFVGLELLKYESCFERQELYYWLRLEKDKIRHSYFIGEFREYREY